MSVLIQIDGLPDELPYNNTYTFAYVRDDNPDMESFRKKFLKHLGGQSHVQCAKHNLPVIASITHTNKCECGRKEFYCCCQFSCTAFMCKKCFSALDINTTTLVTSQNENKNKDSSSSNSELDFKFD